MDFLLQGVPAKKLFAMDSPFYFFWREKISRFFFEVLRDFFENEVDKKKMDIGLNFWFFKNNVAVFDVVK